MIQKSFYEELQQVFDHCPLQQVFDHCPLQQVFDHCPKYHMKILFGDFNAKVRRKNIFKLTNWNDSLHQDSNDNGVRKVNFATSKNPSC